MAMEFTFSLKQWWPETPLVSENIKSQNSKTKMCKVQVMFS